MSTTETPELWEPAELPAFDDAQLRRAIRRGVIRTAVRGAGIVFLVLLVASIAGGLIQSALHRQDQMNHLVIAWQVAHPDYAVDTSSASFGGWSSNETLDAHPMTAGEPAGSTPVHLRLNILGDLNFPAQPSGSSASQVLIELAAGNGPPHIGAERKMLIGLPASAVAAAVVQFAEPMTEADYAQFINDHETTRGGFDLAPVLFDGPGGKGFSRPGWYGWSPVYDHFASEQRIGSDPVREFQQWVHRWHNSDAGNLRNVGIDLSALRQAARDGRIRGVILTQQSPSFFLRLLNDPRVAGVHLYDATFATEGTGQN